MRFLVKITLFCQIPWNLMVLDSIVVSIPACHAGDRGSIPRRGGHIFKFLQWRITKNGVIKEKQTPGTSVNLIIFLLCAHLMPTQRYTGPVTLELILQNKKSSPPRRGIEPRSPA